MNILIIALLGSYLTLVMLAVAVDRRGARKIPVQNAILTAFSVLVTILSTYLYWVQDSSLTFLGVVVGLLGISALALHNGFYIHQRPNYTHHVIRLMWHLLLLGLLYWII